MRELTKSDCASVLIEAITPRLEGGAIDVEGAASLMQLSEHLGDGRRASVWRQRGRVFDDRRERRVLAEVLVERLLEQVRDHDVVEVLSLAGQGAEKQATK